MPNKSYDRRDWLRISLASATGLSSAGWLPHLAQGARLSSTSKSCILLWMSGGPSQFETFDPKSGHENGGPTKSIPTAVPGLHISEHLPLLAGQMKDLAIIRDLNTGEGDHERGTQLMLTGYRPTPATAYPTIGSLLSKELGEIDQDLPNYVSISSGRRIVSGSGSGFLGPQYAPLVVSGNSDNPTARADLSIDNLAPPFGNSPQVMAERFQALERVQAEFGKHFQGGAAAAHRSNAERAVRMIESQARHAFRLDEESSALRDSYGRNRFGQGCLLARRLIERGVPCVEVEFSGSSNNDVLGWDTHADNFQRVRTLCQILDPAWSTLMNDLRDRGMLASTLVLWMGEFGRTPQINETTGRDHWASGWSAVVGGAGIVGGGAVGDTGRDGMRLANSNPEGTKVADLFATVYKALDIDHEKTNLAPGDRPIGLVDQGGKPIPQLFGST